MCCAIQVRIDQVVRVPGWPSGRPKADGISGSSTCPIQKQRLASELWGMPRTGLVEAPHNRRHPETRYALRAHRALQAPCRRNPPLLPERLAGGAWRGCPGGPSMAARRRPQDKGGCGSAMLQRGALSCQAGSATTTRRTELTHVLAAVHDLNRNAPLNRGQHPTARSESNRRRLDTRPRP